MHRHGSLVFGFALSQDHLREVLCTVRRWSSASSFAQLPGGVHLSAFGRFTLVRISSHHVGVQVEIAFQPFENCIFCPFLWIARGIVCLRLVRKEIFLTLVTACTDGPLQVEAGSRFATGTSQQTYLFGMDFSRCWLGAYPRCYPHLTTDVQDSLKMGQAEIQVAAIRRVAVVPSAGRICHALL